MDRDALSVVPEASPIVPGASAAAQEVLDAARSPAAPRPSAFRALGHRPFRLYFAGQIASASGTFLQQTAIGWLVLRLTGSPASLGLVLAAGGLPSLLFGPWGGTLVDRVDVRRLLVGTQLLLGLLAAALWTATAAGWGSLGLIMTVNVLSGVVGIVDSPARQTFVSSLVPPDDLSSAISLNGVIMNSARVVGPAVAGLVIVVAGTTPCFAINAVSYLAVVGALLLIRPLRPPARGRSGGHGVWEGLRYARTLPQLWLPLAMMSVVGLLAFNFPVILPVLARETFHGDGGTYGLLSTVLSVGSVGGSFVVSLIPHPRRVYLLSAVLAFAVCLGATALAPNLVLACVALLFTGLAGFAFVTLASTALQLHADPAYRGRIMALWVFVFLGTTPIGSVLTGWISSAASPRVALGVGAAACLLAAGMASRVHNPPHPDAGAEAR
ncbi:MAG TPA: MFS transporter [Pseudonocardia sp.]|nr:MFS transporter [Pseudonocardia sp.]